MANDKLGVCTGQSIPACLLVRKQAILVAGMDITCPAFGLEYIGFVACLDD